MALNKDRRDKNEERESRTYEKKLTIEVDIEGEERTTMMDLLKAVKVECGTVIGCRFKTPKKYELTMLDEGGKKKLLDGLRIGNNIITAKELSSDELVVSFMALPVYITDGEILDRLAFWGVSAVSPIKRRVWPGTDIVEGTRFVKVRFTQEVRSLPYSVKFETLMGTEHFRVIHDKQVKVCRLCIRPGHIIRDCPEFTCFKCGGQGHYARECAGNEREESDEFYSEAGDNEEGEEMDGTAASEGEERVEPTPAEAEVMEETTAAEGEEREEPTPAEAEVVEEITAAEGEEEEEEATPAETEVVEETPSAEREEVESEGGHQHAAQRDGEEPQVHQVTAVAHQVPGQATEIGSSMDGVLEEIGLFVEGKIGRVVGVGPSAGPAPPPSDHVSTSMGGPTGMGRSSIGMGRARRAGGGVKTRGGLSSGPASETREVMRRREPGQEPLQMSPGVSEENSDFAQEDMDLSLEGINKLKRKAQEERRRKNVKK